MALTESLQRQAIRELGEKSCAVCGGEKKPNQSFCKPCYFSLPPRMRQALYSPLGENYASSYDAAKDYLRIETDRGGKK